MLFQEYVHNMYDPTMFPLSLSLPLMYLQTYTAAYAREYSTSLTVMGCLFAFILIAVFVLALVVGCLLHMKCCYGNPVMYAACIDFMRVFLFRKSCQLHSPVFVSFSGLLCVHREYPDPPQAPQASLEWKQGYSFRPEEEIVHIHVCVLALLRFD